MISMEEIERDLEDARETLKRIKSESKKPCGLCMGTGHMLGCLPISAFTCKLCMGTGELNG